MATDFIHSHENFGPLSRAVEVEQGPAVRKRVGHLDLFTIPAWPLIVAGIRIDRITTVETMRQGDRLPSDIVRRRVAAPDFPGAAERALMVFPPIGETLAGLGTGKVGKGRG